ncbi:MAG: AEC family transporter [Xenococcus sp. (in: cyanobacteria)]
MLEKILPLVIIFVAGYLLKKLKVLRSEDTKVLGKLLANLVLPAIVFKSLYTAQIEANLLYLPVAAFLVVSSLTLIAWLSLRFLKRDRSRQGAFLTTFPTFEGGVIGYPFMFLTFGDLGLSRIVLFDMAQAIFLFTVVYFISCQFGQTKFEIRQGIENLVKTPIIWAIVLALILKTIGFNNSLLLDSLSIIENSFFFLILILLSLEFNLDLSYFKLCLLTTIAKTFCGAGLGWLTTMIFGFTGVEQVAVIVGSSLPPSMLTLIFAEKNNLDTKFVANLLSIALPFSCLFLSLLLRLFLLKTQI